MNNKVKGNQNPGVLIVSSLIILTSSAEGQQLFFADDFNGNGIDTAKWNMTIATTGKRWCSTTINSWNSGEWVNVDIDQCHSLTQSSPYGSVTVNTGQVTFSTDFARTFPYIWTGPPSRPLPFPNAGDFILEVRMKYNSIEPHGNGLHALFWSSTEPIGSNPPMGQNDIFSIWANPTPLGGLHAYILGNDVSISNLLSFHHYRIEYVGGEYSLFVDDVLKSGPIASNMRPNTIWLGNPIFTYWLPPSTKWSSFAIDFVRVTIPTAALIFPTANDPQLVNQEFWVDVNVGNTTNPVSNLFGVSFCLTFTHTEFIDVVTPYSSNVVAGAFLGNDLVFQSSVDEPAGKVCIGVSRKAGQGGVGGYGTIARIKFKAALNTPDSTQVQFCVTEVVANDPSGNSISLIPGCTSVTIHSCIPVWPGDTNNDGIVNQVDVLPIGLYWGRTGSTIVTVPSCVWVARCTPPWAIINATYADANGDSIVNQADVLCIGLNWGKTHSTNLSLASGPEVDEGRSNATASLIPEVKPVQSPEQEFSVRIKASEVADLFGLAFELNYDHSNFVRILAVEPDTLLGDDVVFYSNVDSSGQIAVGISRKDGQAGVAGTGSVVRVKAIISGNIPDGTTIQFSLKNVKAIDPNGAALELTPRSSIVTVTTTTVVSEGETAIPSEYRLEQNFPNPFNPTTSIKFSLPRSGHVMLKVYDVTGREIARLVDKELAAGRYDARWDARGVESGTYFYQLRAEGFVETKRLVLLK